MKIVLATGNQGKVEEIIVLLHPLGLEVLSLSSFPHMPAVVEDGDTFAANAQKKALAVARYTGLPALADDSGLEVDCLAGAPGVYSARYAGENKNDQENNRKLLKEMAGVPKEKRTARFRCVMALAQPDGQIYCTEGSCEGFIGLEPKGFGGFGYDPLFIAASEDKTFGELDLATKNRLSHRGKALALMQEKIKTILEEGGWPAP